MTDRTFTVPTRFRIHVTDRMREPCYVHFGLVAGCTLAEVHMIRETSIATVFAFDDLLDFWRLCKDHYQFNTADILSYAAQLSSGGLKLA